MSTTLPDIFHAKPMGEKIQFENVPPEIIASQQPEIEKFKKAQGLSEQYGTIIEDKDYWLILKRTEFPIVIGLPFREVQFILSGDPKTKNIYIHSIHYPKKEYNREYVETMAYLTTSCHYCLEGTKFIPFTQLEQFISSRSTIIKPEDPSMVLGKWANLAGMQGLSFDSVVSNAIVSNIITMPIDRIATEGGRRTTKFVLGLLGVGVPLLLGYRMPGKFEKMKRHMTLFGINMIGYSTDPTKEQWSNFIGDMKRAKAAAMGYGPVEAIKTLFRPRYGGPLNGPRDLKAYGGGVDGPKELMRYDLLADGVRNVSVLPPFQGQLPINPTVSKRTVDFL